MREHTLHFIWENQYFDKSALRIHNGKEVIVKKPGNYNSLDAGPDFAEAEIKIDGIKWVGQLEIHVNSSDWLKHGHQEDQAYANVILHVVYNNDMIIQNQQGEEIPTLELKSLIPPDLLGKISLLVNQNSKLPCHSMIENVADMKVHQWLDRLAVERLKRKSDEILETVEKNNGDWEASYIQTLFKYMGFKVNNEAFLMLAKKIDWKWIQKNAQDIEKLQAYLYGIAGFLRKESKDEYEQKLRNEYEHLKRLLGLSSLPLVSWKFSRMRPANYPTLRIGQLASLFHTHAQLFPDILNRRSRDEFYEHFEVKYPVYWRNHYAFGKKSSNTRKRPGKMSINLLLINVISPVLYAYARYTGTIRYRERSIQLWQALPAENNRIIRKWNKIDVKAENAWDSQALISLYKGYCTEKRCLDCQIGKTILREAMNKYTNRMQRIA